jgi:hypothetical protein
MAQIILKFFSSTANFSAYLVWRKLEVSDSPGILKSGILRPVCESLKP